MSWVEVVGVGRGYKNKFNKKKIQIKCKQI